MADGPITDFATLDQAVQASPFHAWLGVRLSALTSDGIAISMPWRQEFVSDPGVGYMHGGILAALIDLAGDYAVMAAIGRGVPTIDMRVDYHQAAMPGPLVARARIVKLGRTLATAEASVFDERGKLVASGRAVYLTLAR